MRDFRLETRHGMSVDPTILMSLSLSYDIAGAGGSGGASMYLAI